MPVQQSKKKVLKEKIVEAFDCEENRSVTINMNEWCTPKQLAKSLGVSKQVVNNWQGRGKLRVMRIDELGLTLVQVKPDAKLFT